MPSYRILLRLLSCGIVAVATLELCARLDDYFSYGASIFEPYQIDQIYEFDSLGRRGKPNAQFRKWKLNSLGYRGPELQTGSTRIVVFGASETFGLYESPDHEFPRVLERRLNEGAGRGHRFDVVNVAYAGMPTTAMILRVPEIAARIQPRFGVVYPTPANYIWLPWLKGEQKASRLPKFEFRLKEHIKTALKTVIPKELQNWARSREINRSVLAYGKVMDRVPQANVDRYQNDLRTLGKRLREHGIEPVFLTHASRFHDSLTAEDRDVLVSWRKFYPMLSEQGFIDMERRMNDATRALTAEGFTVIDIARKIPPGSDYFADFTHFTDEGSKLVAEAVSEGLLPIVTNCCPETRQFASTQP